MNAHFSIINKRGVLLTALLLVLIIIPLCISLSFLLGGGSKLWIAGLVIFGGFFLFGIMLLISVLNGGIDVARGMVILPDLEHPEKGKIPKFHVRDLKDVLIVGKDDAKLDLETDSLGGAHVVFFLQDGTEVPYYPLTITRRQFKNLRDGILVMASDARDDF